MSPKVFRVIDFGALWGARFLIAVMAILPEKAATVLGRFIVEVVLICMPRLRGVGLRNLELVFPEKSAEERRRILRSSFWVIGRNLYWFSRVPRMTAQDIERGVENAAEARAFVDGVRARSKGGGVMYATMHFGWFEMTNHIVNVVFGPMHMLARGFGMPLLDEWWNKRREIFGGTVFSRSGGFAEAMRVLAAGGDVAMLCDQNVKVNYAAYIDLFGVKAATSKGPVLAAMRNGAPLIVGVSVEVSPGRFRALYDEVAISNDTSVGHDERVEDALRKVHAVMERILREYPEQWYWVHRRFKTRPPGEPETIYSDVDGD